MKKTNKPFLILLLHLTTVLLFSCASSSARGPEQLMKETHPDRYKKTVIGMDINEFKTVWPEAKRSVASEDGETYEFIYTNFAHGGDFQYIKVFVSSFYFTGNKLVKFESTQKAFSL